MLHRARKRFGQHFLHDAGVIRRIVDAIGPRPDNKMVEIGPGLGAITFPLLQRLGRLHVIELDRDVLPALVKRCAGTGELIIYQADALKFDFSNLASSEGKVRVVGNLPYNIATPLIFYLLEQLPAIEDMHFLLQREVVERISASPGSGAYGRISVMMQYRCRCARLFTVGSGAFSPSPKIESAFLRLTPYPQPQVAIDDERRFALIVGRAFTQRRKKLKNALKKLLSTEAIEAAGVDPSVRPEMLTLSDYAALSNVGQRD
jgi:16S rRNA (adenine1518-N6/adenine1519-N6)-dimethyltransferase